MNVPGVDAMALGAGQRNEERRNPKHNNDKSDDKQCFHKSLLECRVLLCAVVN
jgi:hypothetical protein